MESRSAENEPHDASQTGKITILTHSREARLVPVIRCISPREGKENDGYSSDNCAHPTPTREKGANREDERC